uniref:N-acetyltransferase domain-containing protein n=1 Tax=Acrobeloides nanus TaxID=290746 RepID=A0A914E9I9_9BILA
MCRRLLSNGSAPSIHLYTMNREGSCREILQALGLWQQNSIRTLPWGSHCYQRPLSAKDVRPIFWSYHPESYDWDEFSNGKLGNASSPAYNDLQDYYLFYLKGLPTKEELSKMYYNELKSVDDVKKVFINFIKQVENENGVKVSRLPWSEKENGTSVETNLIKDQLLWCNENGILTINSQPSVNGAPSTDPLVGWGKPGGYCYQRAYLECFICEENAHKLRKLLDEYPQINYHIINHDCSIDWTNSDPTEPIAVTWGVFPGCEIAQPTVVDPLSFRVWKGEAYDAWLNKWANIYPDGGASQFIIQYHTIENKIKNRFPETKTTVLLYKDVNGEKICITLRESPWVMPLIVIGCDVDMKFEEADLFKVFSQFHNTFKHVYDSESGVMGHENIMKLYEKWHLQTFPHSKLVHYTNYLYYSTDEQKQGFLEADINLPEGYRFSEVDFQSKDIEIICNSWVHARNGDMEVFRAKLLHMPYSLVRDQNDYPVAYEFLEMSSLFNHQYVHPEHRGKGLGNIVERDLAKKSIKLGITPNKAVLISNKNVTEASNRSPYWTRWDHNGEPLVYLYLATDNNL